LILGRLAMDKKELQGREPHTGGKRSSQTNGEERKMRRRKGSRVGDRERRGRK